MAFNLHTKKTYINVWGVDVVTSICIWHRENNPWSIICSNTHETCKQECQPASDSCTLLSQLVANVRTYYSIDWLTGVNVEVSVLWSVSLGNVHNTIRNRVNGLTKKLWCSQTSRGSCVNALIYTWTHVTPDWSIVAYRHTWYSLSNPLSLSLCMAFTCSEKSDLCTSSDRRSADSTVKVTKSIRTIKYSRDTWIHSLQLPKLKFNSYRTAELFSLSILLWSSTWFTGVNGIVNKVCKRQQ